MSMNALLQLLLYLALGIAVALGIRRATQRNSRKSMTSVRKRAADVIIRDRNERRERQFTNFI